MNINVYQQLFNLLVFIITGIIIGVLFDIFRIIRRSFKTADFITYIEDILFWILTGLILLFMIFTFNNGEIRIYIFVGLILGFITYLLTVSRYFIKICIMILKFIKKILYFPIRVLFNFMKKYIIKPVLDILQKIKLKFTKWIKKPIENTPNANFPNIYHKNL